MVCAALLPGRVVAAAIVCGVTDFAWPAAWDGYDEMSVNIMRLGDEAKAKARCDEELGPNGERAIEHIRDLSPADHEFIETSPVAGGFVATVREAFRQGTGGFAQDCTVESRPWAFAPSTIAIPVRVVHGEDDTIVPVAHARHTAEVVPGATLEILPGHGHLSIVVEFPRIIGELGAALR